MRGRDLGRLIGHMAAILEEVAEELGGFGLEQASLDEEGMVEAGIGWDVVEGTCVSGFRVWGRVD